MKIRAGKGQCGGQRPRLHCSSAFLDCLPSLVSCNPKIEVSRSLALPKELGDDIEIVCSWSPIEVWFGLPNTSGEFNDTLNLENYGDEDFSIRKSFVDGCEMR